jgi:hypothetical protein
MVRRPLESLYDPASYVVELERLCERARAGGSDPEELGYRGLRHHARPLGRRLADSVRRGEYRFGAARARPALIAGKVRTLYRFSAVDSIVLGVLARTLRDLVDPWVSDRVFSYRPGRSSLLALSELGAHLRSHVAAGRLCTSCR